MTIRIQGRSVADGNIGNVTDFTQIEAAEGRIFETIDNANNLSTWIVESTDKGGNLISGGLYANPLNSSTSIPKPIMSIPFGINQTEEFLNGSVSCVRSTVKNYTDIYGVVRQAPVNTIAIEKDGALIEGSSTNLILYSEDLTNLAWVKTNSTITSNADTAPDLSSSSDLITQTSSAGLVLQFITSLPLSTEITFSVYVKQSTSVVCQVATFDGSVFSAANVDLTNGQITLKHGNFIGSKSEKVYNDYYRVEVTLSSSSASTCDFRIYPTPPGQANVGSVFAFGSQVEIKGFATSRITTTASPATRAADVVTIPALNNYLGQNEGEHSIYIKASSKNQVATVLNAKSTTGQNEKYRFQINNDRGEFSNGSTTTTNTPSATVSNLNSYALTFDGVKSLAYINGVSGDDGLSPADSELDTASPLTIGSRDSGAGDNMYGHVKDLKVFNVSLSATQIKGLG